MTKGHVNKLFHIQKSVFNSDKSTDKNNTIIHILGTSFKLDNNVAPNAA